METIEEKARKVLEAEYARLMTEYPQAEVCPLCKGDGGIGFSVEINHPAFGRIFRCPCQDAWKRPEVAVNSQQVHLEALFGKDGIPRRISHFTFATFKELPAAERESRSRAIRACISLAKNGRIRMENGVYKFGAVLSGQPGVGKSALSVATARAIAEYGNAVLWKDFNDLIADIKATYNRDYKGPSQQQLIDAAGNARALVLDDVGAITEGDHMTTNTREILYAIVRQRHADSRVTLITTNLSKERMKAEADPRTYRRILDLCLWIKMDGNDLTAYGE